MAHWPRSIGGNVMAVMLALIVVVGFVQLAMALASHPQVWIFLVVVALTTTALIVRNRRAAAASDLALADAPSFGDVLPHWDRHDDLIPVRRRSTPGVAG